MDQDELLRLAVGALEALEMPYLVTGSIATIFYGEPRFTNDIDIVIQVTPDRVDALVDVFDHEPLYVSREAAHRAVRQTSQFNVIHPRAGLKIDFMVAKMDALDHSRFERARRVRPAEDYDAAFASPEDVILKKLQYYRESRSDKHLRDCAGVLRITPNVDRDYIARWAELLEVSDLWEALREQSPPEEN